ncbi:Anti-sigma regulatory factor (Ser/Thr protein kinase) [Streptomyces sp. 2231.1]|nr:Anti-sigma regulatory factor (Ser/Thr protein kinase) [Streptomyces sp. 2231.1]
MRADSVGWRPRSKGGVATDDRHRFVCRCEWTGGVWRRVHGEFPALLMLDSDGSSIGEARRAAARYTAACCPPVDAEDVELIVSELCTNAYRHATGWWRLCVHAHRGRLVLDVDDASTTPPRPGEPDNVHGTGGLGLLLVARLADEQRLLRYPAGKTVRVVLRF